MIGVRDADPISSKYVQSLLQTRFDSLTDNQRDSHTSVTDLPLTAKGERSIIATGNALVGPDRVILPENLAHMYVLVCRCCFAHHSLSDLILPLDTYPRDSELDELLNFSESTVATNSPGNQNGSMEMMR